MELTPRDIFIDYLINIDDPGNLETYFNDCFSFIVGEADSRGIEFEGYFKSKWEDSANTIYEFDDEYFDNIDRKKLFVYLSCLYNQDIFNILKDAYEVVDINPPNENEIREEVKKILDAGIDF